MLTKARTLPGFTLIELLIVVAIIAILAAIAVPNFLEAQVRSKVARVKSDQRTISTALESYAIDNNGKYPHLPGNAKWTPGAQVTRGPIIAAYPLSTPVAYLATTAMLDPFCKTKFYDQFGYTSIDIGTGTGNLQAVFGYVNVPLTMGKSWKGDRPAWWVVSNGPDYLPGPDVLGKVKYWTATTYGTGTDPSGGHEWTAYAYDPSNGTISGGDVWRHQ